jgi:hypothetical protein
MIDWKWGWSIRRLGSTVKGQARRGGQMSKLVDIFDKWLATEFKLL